MTCFSQGPKVCKNHSPLLFLITRSCSRISGHLLAWLAYSLNFDGLVQMITVDGNRTPAPKPPGMYKKPVFQLVGGGITNKTTGLFCQPQLVLLRFLNHQNIISFLNNFPFQGTNSLIFTLGLYAQRAFRNQRRGYPVSAGFG